MNRRTDEAKLQSKCVLYMWNEKPKTRMLFFQVKNEGARVSTTIIREHVNNILKNPHQGNIVKCCNAILEHLRGNAVTGGLDRAMGVVSGVSDCILIWNGTAHCFEFKTEKGKQSDTQIEFQKKVENEGVSYYIIRSFEQFEGIISIIMD